MLSGSLETVREGDIISMLFTRQDSRLAARVFLDWLKGKGGRCSKEEMSRFSHELASGKLRARLSRTNFYKGLLHHFLDLGLIAEQLEYDHGRRKTIRAYRAVIQPVTKHRPMGPSLPYLAALISEKWNREFT